MMLYEALLALNLRADFIRVMDFSKDCAGIRANTYNDEYAEMASRIGGPDIFYRAGFEAMEIADLMIETDDLRNGMPGWDRLGPVEWIRHPRDSQLEIAHLAVSSSR